MSELVKNNNPHLQILPKKIPSGSHTVLHFGHLGHLGLASQDCLDQFVFLGRLQAASHFGFSVRVGYLLARLDPLLMLLRLHMRLHRHL